MGEISCPQCGNPNLDVDAQNNVVYCKNCGFAVQVDPQTGNVTPISQGGAPQQQMGGGAQGGAMPSMHKTILGMEPFVFLSVALLLVLLAALLFNFQTTTTIIAIVAVLLAYFFGKR